MRRERAVVTCAMTALAMVFSVQQGEHGPLVVYKLKVPEESAVVATPAPAGPVTVIPARAPKVPGTVAMPPAAPDAPAVPGVTVGDILEQIAPPVAAPTAAAPATVPSEAGLDWGSENGITLDQVSNEITWRRETAERLPNQPFAPRF